MRAFIDNPVRRVLVVADCPDLRESLLTLLPLWGKECRVVGSARGALRLAEEFAPQVVLLDLDLTDTSVTTLAADLRRTPGCQGMELVGLGGARHRQSTGTVEADFDHRLGKPLDLAELEALLLSDPACL